MTKIAVLDDNTADANVIGYAADETEAAEIFLDYHRERMSIADFAELQLPAFAYRSQTSVASPAFEPLV